MKKRVFVLFLSCVLLMTILTSCNEKSKSLTACGEDVISLMVAMVESDSYPSLYNFPDSYNESINRLREGNYSQCVAVYELSVAAEELIDGAIDQNGLSKELYDYLCSSAYMSFASRINISGGAEVMTVTSVFSAQKSYATKDITASRIFVYTFENGCPIAITFVNDGEGSLRAVGHFIMNDEFITEDENTIKASCEALGIHDVTVKKQ